MRVGEVECIAASGGVFQVSDVVFLPAVIREIVEAAPADAWPGRAAFAGVVVHHVHQYFEAGVMQRLHHIDDLLAYGVRARLLCGFGGV